LPNILPKKFISLLSEKSLKKKNAGDRGANEPSLCQSLLFIPISLATYRDMNHMITYYGSSEEVEAA
jgi:hypothetical protein